MPKTDGLIGVVIGGTGAVGCEIVGQLLANPRWAEVRTVGRRPVEVPAAYSATADTSKLKQVTVNMDNLESEASSAFSGADTAFCALGSTRGAAGSAQAFKKVDVDYVEAAAKAAKAGGVPLFSLCSAQGANANQWASEAKVLHALFYMKCKGLAEEAAKAQNLALGVSIARPGLLDRGGAARSLSERVVNRLSFMPKVLVSDVAKVLIADAEKRLAVSETGDKVFEMKDILRLAKEG